MSVAAEEIYTQVYHGVPQSPDLDLNPLDVVEWEGRSMSVSIQMKHAHSYIWFIYTQTQMPPGLYESYYERKVERKKKRMSQYKASQY